jgi:hypothetical protein
MMAEASASPPTLNTVDGEEGSFDDVETAITGINMLLNNGFDEAFALFDKYKYVIGVCLFSVIQAVWILQHGWF